MFVTRAYVLMSSKRGARKRKKREIYVKSEGKCRDLIITASFLAQGMVLELFNRVRTEHHAAVQQYGLFEILKDQ